MLITPELYKAYGRYEVIVLIGCRASGKFGDYCEYDLLIPFERFGVLRERRGGEYFDLHFVPWDELLVSELAYEAALGSFRVIKDEDWSLSPYISELISRREELSRIYREGMLKDAKLSLMRAYDSLEFGDGISASYWIQQAAYYTSKACISKKEVARRSHILTQLRPYDIYGDVSGILYLTMASKVTAWRRLDALRRMAEYMKRKRLRGRGLSYLHLGEQGLRMEERRGIEMVKEGRIAEFYASLGLLIVDGLKEIYEAECEREGIRPYYERIGKELVKEFEFDEFVFKLSGLKMRREEIKEGLKKLRAIIEGLGERAFREP